MGTGATLTAGDSISDPGTGDGDIVNISGDGAVDLSAPATGISGFETINLDLEKQQDGTAFAISNVGNDVETMTLDVADSTEVVCQTSPISSTEEPSDFDEDGTCDLIDPDDDNDG